MRGSAQRCPIRPSHWARPLGIPGVPNLHHVDAGLFRSGQPERHGLRILAEQHGVRTVISLRGFHGDEAVADGLGLTLMRIPIRAWLFRQGDVLKVLGTVVRQRRNGGVLLHCLHGADRTGLVCALYRMVLQDWDRNDAIAELRDGKFGYHSIWGRRPPFLIGADVEAMRIAIDREGRRTNR